MHFLFEVDGRPFSHSPNFIILFFVRLNIGKYSKRPNIAKALFEYIFYHENSIREAMELASQALQASKYEDWYWKVQLGKCYFRLGMFRDSEKMFKSALKQQEMIDTFLLLSKVYVRLDQPMAALEVYRTGLDKFPNEVSLLTGMSRIYEALNNLSLSTKYYKLILIEDAINVEAIGMASNKSQYQKGGHPKTKLTCKGEGGRVRGHS